MIEQQVASIDEHRDLLVTQTLEAAAEGLQLFKSTATFSRLPAHLAGLGGKQFLRITTHEPDDHAERRGRIAAAAACRTLRPLQPNESLMGRRSSSKMLAHLRLHVAS